MTPLRFLARNSRSFRSHPFLVSTLVLGLGLLGCSELVDTAGPADPGVAAVVSQQSEGLGSITVEVRKGNQRFENVLVTIVHNENGPFREAGNTESILKELTDAAGIAVFDDLPIRGNGFNGGYCAHITAIASREDALAVANVSDLDEEEGLVVPLAEQAGATVDIAPAITQRQGGGGNVRTVPFTEGNYTANCVYTRDSDEANLPPIQLTEQRPNASVRLSPEPGASLQATFRNLEGAAVPAAGWLVFGHTDQDWRGYFRWLSDFGVPTDIHPGILMSVGGQNQNGALFRGLPPGREVALEALSKQGGAGQTVLMATGRTAAPASGGTGTETFALEPLMCTLDNTKEANPGTATGSAIEIVDRVKDGFLADENFEPVASGLSIWYRAVGTGDDALKLRFKSKRGATQNLNVPYSCTAAGCSEGAASGGASGTVQVQFFHRPSDGIVTWLLHELPFGDDLASVEYQLRDFPEASKEDETRAYSLVQPGPGEVRAKERCEIDQSNDPAWWIGT